MQFEIHTVTINHLRTFYLEGGTGKTLIFLHGWGARASSYHYALNLFAKNHHVIALEMPGFGKSADPRTVWTFDDYANYLTAFLDNLPDANVTLVGHSLGGGFALYAAAKSKKVTNLILIDAMGLPLEHRRGSLYAFYSFQILLDLFTHADIKLSIHLTRNFFQNLAHLRYLIPFTYKIFDRQLAVNTTIFNQLTIPVTILWGTKDSIFGKTTAEKLRSILPNATLEFVPGSHNWIIFEPEKAKAFLSS